MAQDDLPLVTVLIPARDAALDIEGCLDTVLAQGWPLDHLEVVLVDGRSVDDTVARVERRLTGTPLEHWTVVSNEGRSIPSNLNAGLAVARGDIVCRVDIRSRLPVDYVERCVGWLLAQPEISVVGGAQVAVARDEQQQSLGIARALNNRFAMGLSRYRRSHRSGPADTVYLGAFRRSDLVASGGWDERLLANEDFDLNQRMAEFGAVWFDAGIDVGYVPRPSLSGIFWQYHKFGRWKVRFWRLSGSRPRPRQLVLLLAPLGLAVGLVGVVVRRPSRWWRLLGLGALLAVLAEWRGSRRPDAGLRGHVVSLAASACVAAGWLSGIWSEWFRVPLAAQDPEAFADLEPDGLPLGANGAGGVPASGGATSPVGTGPVVGTLPR